MLPEPAGRGMGCIDFAETTTCREIGLGAAEDIRSSNTDS